MAVKMNSTIITKNHTADQEIGFLAQSISKSNGCATAMPTAWELKITKIKSLNQISAYFHKIRGFLKFFSGKT